MEEVGKRGFDEERRVLDDSNDGAITAGGATAPRFSDVAVGSAGGAGALGGALGSGCAYLGNG